MMHRAQLAAVMLFFVALPPCLYAQGQEPEKPTASASPVTPPETFRPGSAGSYGLPASPDPLLEPGPYQLDRPDQTLGWFANLDVALVKPHLKSHLTSATPPSPAFTEPVALPSATLDWTVQPRVELGYRLPHGWGDLRFAYQNLTTNGSESVGIFDAAGSGSLSSRLNMNLVDLDYVSSESLFPMNSAPDRDLRVGLGVRMMSCYFDSIAQGLFIRDERQTNQFLGVGPRAFLDLVHGCCFLPVAGYVHVDASGLVGSTNQDFGEAQLTAAGTLVGAARAGGAQSNGVASLCTEVGACWPPNGDTLYRIMFGYHFEQWWNLGRTDDSDAELTVQGVFLRGELRY